MFGVSVEQVKKQFSANLEQLEKSKIKAELHGKKVNNYSAEEYNDMISSIKTRIT